MNDLIVWPDVFVTGELEATSRAEAIATGLVGWGNCSLSTPPDKFGEGMAAIGRYLDMVVTPESLMNEAELLKEQPETVESEA